MRIAFVLSSLKLSGGVRVVIEYANYLVRRGHAITLVIPGGTADSEMLAELNQAVVVKESPIQGNNTGGLWHLCRLTWSLAKTVPSADVLISTHTPTTVVSWLAGKVWRKGRLVWLYQDYRAMFRGRAIEDWLLRHALYWHEAALTVSAFAQQELATFAPGRIFVIGEGLSHAEYFKAVPVTERPFTGEYIILTMGDMRRRKGFADFLQAVELVHAKIPRLKLWIFAKEPCKFETKIPYEFFYRPDRKLLAELYASCHLFVSASHWESFGLPPLEAMACGAPVVMTNSHGVMEYASPGENCLITPPAEPVALAAAMEQVLQNCALAQKLSANGPQTAQDFSWENAVARFEAALQTIII